MLPSPRMAHKLPGLTGEFYLARAWLTSYPAWQANVTRPVQSATCNRNLHYQRSSSVSLLLLSGIYNPYEFEPPQSGGSDITQKDAPQSVGLLWKSDQPVAETSTWQHTQHSERTTIHSPVGIRTRNPSRRSAVDTLCRPLGHSDRSSVSHVL
jgi:hypothetical protein